ASLRDNVSPHVPAPTGRLHEAAAHAFDTFRADAQVHYSLVAAIARGDVRWHRRANRVAKTGAALSPPLASLQELHVGQRVAPVGRSPTSNRKRPLYRLDDPYLRFWHLFVADLRARGVPQTLPPEEIWDVFVAPRLDEYVGRYVFEEICRQFVATGSATLPFRPVQVGSWWSADHSVEVDVVALGPGDEVLMAECKWGAVTREDVTALER